MVQCLDGKRLETVAFRCTPEVRELLDLEAEYLGITLSKVTEKIVRDFVCREGKSCEQGLHPLESGVTELQRLTIEICVDGVVSPIERARFTRKATELLHQIWHEVHEKEGVA
ncbi:hypothetical protein MYX75_01135 [Acidobacteria bacterium AH-259-A15]|nr:hypothetical protein [Acidobacteria bacterium AH-259-A15]